MDYFNLILLINIFFLIVSITNILFLRKTSFFRKPKIFPKISILIPARNEEKNIESCLDSILNIDYPDYEVIVLNDNSTDNTENLLKKYLSFPNFRYYNGKDLPYDWKGKTFASEQLFKLAKGEILFFTDADTIHSKDILKFLVGKMEEFNVDFISGFANQKTITLGEKLIVPSLYILSGLFLPLSLVYKSKNSLFSFAIGQAIFIKKETLSKIGGFESVKNEIVEDMYLARKVKENGYKTIFLDLKNYLECRMYENFYQGFNGISRVIFPAIGKNLFLFIGLVTFVFFSILFPIFYLILNYGVDINYTKISLYSVSIFFLSWGITMLDRKLGLIPVILYPIFFINLLVMAFNSLIKISFGKGITWKERVVK